jgi:hypothetical protein
MAGTSTFVEIYNVKYGTLPIYGVTRISLNRSKSIITGRDNNKIRPVSSHLVGIGETVTIEAEDGYGLMACLSQTGAANLTFNWLAASQNVGTGTMTTQLVTIKNVVFDREDVNFASKALSEGRISGMVLEVSDDSDPVTYTAGTTNP